MTSSNILMYKKKPVQSLDSLNTACVSSKSALHSSDFIKVMFQYCFSVSHLLAIKTFSQKRDLFAA